jgi:hypothetical protein
MEKLSHKKLPEVKGVRIEEDIRFDIPQGRLKFLGRDAERSQRIQG